MNKDQAIDGVGVSQPTYDIIHEEYDWEIEHQSSAKHESLPSEPPLFFPDIFGDSINNDFACVSLSSDAPIFDHLQNTSDVSPSSDNGEDKSFFEHPLDFSYAFPRNREGEHS